MRASTRAAAAAVGLTLVACQEPSRWVGPDSPGSTEITGNSLLLPPVPGLPPVVPGLPSVAPARYIVVFRYGVADPAGVARTLVSGLGGSLLHTYTSAITGFAAWLPAVAVPALRANPLVAWVEADQVVKADVTQSMDASGDPWGLDRIDQGALPLSRTYSYTATGAGVHAYIIDTGIWTLQAEFGGRANNVYDAVLVTGEDCNGHGTHVAGTVGAATYGVAKGVFLHGVRVLNCAGLGFNSDVIAGVDWVSANHARPAVANMSLGGGQSAALNTAVTNLWNSGVFLAVAAGNDNADACNTSPAGATGVFTVAASTLTDAKASFSNWGTCVEAYAPGSAIKSTWLLGVPMQLNGTSMAAPHVAGVAALYKATFGDAPSATVSNWIVTNATTGVITGNPPGTPNRLLYKSTL
jgi:subtilisin family serine protease